VWSVTLTVVAVAMFAFAGYVLVHDDAVHRAGRIPRLPAAETIAPPGTSPSGSTAPSGSPLITAFVGDDWTSGVGASDPSKRFTTLVSAALNLDEKNFGVAGSGYARPGTSEDGGDYASRVADVVAAHPDLVVVSGGRNDVTDNVSLLDQRARRLFEQLRRKLPNATVVAIRPMWGDSPPTKALLKVAQVVRLAAKQAGVPYLGVHDPILDHPGFMKDAADPNDRGYTAVAAAIEERLPQNLPH
jgi:lysophospholipase L1-like esterase